MTERGLSAQDIVELNRLVGGPGAGVRDLGGIEAAAAAPYQTFDGADLHPGLWVKAAVLLRGLITTQYFFDGNKRTAWAAAEALIEINDDELDEIDDDEAEQFALDVVAHRYSLDEIAEWLFAHTTPLVAELGDEGPCDYCEHVGLLPGAEILPREVYRFIRYRSEGVLGTLHANGETDYFVLDFRIERDLIPHVCARCRDGWMRRIDRVGIPTLTELAEKNPMSGDLRRAVAKWAVKTALLRTSLEAPISASWRRDASRRLRQVQRISDGWTVWAMHAGTGSHLLGRLTHCVIGDATTDHSWGRATVWPTTLQTTFFFGNLVLVVCFDKPGLDPVAASGLQQAADSGIVHRVWPGSGTANLPHMPEEAGPMMEPLLADSINIARGEEP